MHDHNQHNHHEQQKNNQTVEYIKFAGVLAFILIAAVLHAYWRGMSVEQFLESFMGSFFVVFASFKLLRLKEFAYGFASYDVLAKRSIVYGFAYPFIQLLVGTAYLLSAGSQALDVFVLILSLISSWGVYLSLRGNKQFHCACLGTVIKLPLSTISLVEDVGMALMALIMLIMR